MKYEQRKKAQPYHETVKQRFPNASYKMIKRLIDPARKGAAMNMRPDPTRFCDLTKHLPSLHSSLSPDERKFEPLATERFSSDRVPPGEGMFFLAIAAIITWASIIGYFLNA